MKNTYSLLYLATFALLLISCSYGEEDGKEPVGNPVMVKDTRTEGDVTITSQRYYDADGNPTPGEGDVFEIRQEKKVTPDGNVTTITSYFDVNGKLVKNGLGFAKLKKSHPDNGTTIYESFDENDKPLSSPNVLFGAAKTVVLNDPKTGETREVRHYGLDGKPMNGRYGPSVEKIDSIPLSGGRIMTRYTYYDADGKYTKFYSLIPGTEEIRDSSGEKMEGRFFDETGATCEATLGSFTFASWKYKKGLRLFGKQLTDDSVTIYNLHGHAVKNLSEADFLDIFYSITWR